MKKMKKIAALFCASCMVVTALAGCGKKETSQTAETGSAATTEKAAESGSGELIALITMDSIDQHWVTLNEGAQKAAKELGVTVPVSYTHLDYIMRRRERSQFRLH